MSNKKISQLQNVTTSGVTPYDLLAIVNYDVYSGTTKNIRVTDLKNYINSGNTDTVFTGGTVSGTTNFTNGLSATTISGTTFYGDGSNLTGFGLPYKVYTALLNQTGTTTPVATVLENTLGVNPIWSYDSIGYYLFTQTGAFPINKTIVRIGNEGSTDFYTLIFRTDDEIGVFTSLLNNIGIGDDNLLYNTSIEIRVYN
jgi:hypothetical protein